MKNIIVLFGLLFGASAYGEAQTELILVDNEHWGLEILSAKPKSFFSLDHAPSAIRFLDNDDNPLNDLVIGFSDQIFIKNFEWYFSTFIWEKEQMATRVILPSDKATIEHIKDLALAEQNNVASPTLAMNDAKLLHLLFRAGILQKKIKKSYFGSMGWALRRAGATFSPDFHIPDFSREYRNIICRFLEKSKSKNPCLRKLVRNRFLEWEMTRSQENLNLQSDEEFWNFLLTETSRREKALVMRFGSLFQLGSSQAQALTNDSDLLNWPFEKYISIFPKELYQICELEDLNCREGRLMAMTLRWDLSTLRKWTEHLHPRTLKRAIANGILVADMMQLKKELLEMNEVD